jgi:DNA-binding XRE family transcriptional regulator
MSLAWPNPPWLVPACLKPPSEATRNYKCDKALEWAGTRRTPEGSNHVQDRGLAANWLRGPASGAARERAGLSQRELADRAGCNPFTIAKLEGGRQEPAWPLVLALAKALRVTCLEFNGKAASGFQETRPRGRPPKAAPPGPKTKRPRGRPRKGG